MNARAPDEPRRRTTTSAPRRSAAAARDGAPTDQPTLDVAREMRHRWHAGERPAAEEFFSRRPELLDQPEAAVELIYEEYCLRLGANEVGVDADILRRFPQWASPLRVMLDCHRQLLESQRDRPHFPAVGDRVGDFVLTAELARGSRGRVFVATQTALADRPVVLKVTPLDGAEHVSLARLQHTNIVPLYSVTDVAERNVRVLCMPYFGRATLASVLDALANVPVASRTGQHVADAIDRMQEPSETAPGAMPATVSYEQAVCWIVASLADALHFAHERGLVHLDLKPSNVLLAGDGQPMLLDFHLARGPIRPGGPFPDNFGGTPPYMPPEQLAAMQSLRAGGRIDVTVDGRADVYALGAMLYESLGGALPITDDAPPLSRINPRATIGLSDIVAKCVAANPNDRYATARALADDLRRHLTDQPLAGVPNRDWSERWAKWRRRRPSALRTAAALLLVLAAIAAVLSGAWAEMSERRELARLALRDGQRQIAGGNAADAVATLQRGLALAERVPFESDLARELRDQHVLARRLQLTEQLHRLAGEIRVLYGVDSIPADGARALAERCAALWDQRRALAAAVAPARDTQVADDLRDVAIFAAHLRPRTVGGDRDALRILDEAAADFGPSAVLEHERRAHGAGDAAQPPPVPRTAWEHYALGRALLASGDLPRANEQLSAALKLDPAGRWPNFYYGLCAYRMGRHEDAVTAYSVCIGTAPDVAGCFYNRALAYAALHRPAQALADYDRALQLDPAHAAAALNRGMLHFEQGRVAQAKADLAAALSHGADGATVHYDLALVHLSVNEPAAAMEQVKLALASNPKHEPSRVLRETLVRGGSSR